MYIRIATELRSIFWDISKFALKTLELYCQTEQIRILKILIFTVFEVVFLEFVVLESQICTFSSKTKLVFFKNKSFPPESDGNG